MNLKTFKTEIENLPEKPKYEKSDLLTDSFLIEKEGDLEIYFAAHNEYVNRDARLLIIGITPGWFQMERSIRVAKQLMKAQVPYLELLKVVKQECRFAGTMRKNLIEMLNELNLAGYFGINSAAELFGEKDDLLHTVSAIKYPVFVKGKNYTGHSPSIKTNHLLMNYVYQMFESDVKPLDRPLILPLGKAVEDVLITFVENEWIDEHQCLFGFPHPSGANGHRFKQFTEHKEGLIAKIRNYCR